MRENVIKPKSEEPKFYHEALRFRGPVRRRSCTDVAWLVLFLLLLPSWGFVGYYSITRTNSSVLYEITQLDDSHDTGLCGTGNSTSCQEFIQMLKEWKNDVTRSWIFLASGLLLTAAVCCVYTILLRWMPTIIVWASIIEWLTLQGYSIYLIYELYANESGSIWLLIGDGVAFLVILIILVAVRKRIQQTIQLIKEGSKLVATIKSTLLLPFFLGITTVGMFSYGAVVALYIYVGDHNSQFQSKISLYSLYSADIFSLLWTWLFINCMADMIFASTFSSWYWRRDKKKIPTFILIITTSRIIRYHLGTIAIGSLLLSSVRGMRCVAEAINKFSQYTGSVGEFVGNFLRCFCWLMDEFINYLNKNALIMCSLHGTSFYKSARDASDLIIRSASTSIVIDKLVDYIFFFNKMLISISMGLGLYLIQHWEYFIKLTSLDRRAFGPVPSIVLGLTTFFITSLFFNAYSMAVDTLYLCHLQDCAVNDGTDRRPYMTTASVRRIFKK